MSTTLFNNYDFAFKSLFNIRFDYNECMKQPFYKELYNLYRKQKDGQRKFTKGFKSYLYAAHKACAILTVHLDCYEYSDYYQDMFYSALKYLSEACCKESDEGYVLDDENTLFDTDEICLILMISYALLSAKNNPPIPFDLIEYCENQITERGNIDRVLEYIRILGFPELNRLLSRDKKDLAIAKWELIVQIFWFDIQNILKSYTQEVEIDFTLTPIKWDLAYWSEEDLADWICYEDGLLSDIIGSPQYDAEKAKHFVSFWKQKDRKLTVVNAIEEWSKENLKAFGSIQLWRVKVGYVDAYREYLKSNPLDPDQLEADRAQAIKELYEYVETLHTNEENNEGEIVEQEINSEAQVASSVRLKLNDKKGPNNIINTVRIFNVLHELGFFADDKGLPITKKALFEGLANTFGCTELTDWSNKLSSARGQAAGSRKADLKIFDILKQAQEAYLDRLDEQAEQRYR